MKTMSLDESGDHNLRRIDPGYPVFVLGGVIFEGDYARIRADEAIRAFKRDLFGRTDFVLHTVEITRNAGVFSVLQDHDFRTAFFRELSAVLRDLEFSVVACAVRKDRLDAESAAVVGDPYHYALERLVIRFCEIIGNQHRGGRIRAEQRQPALDRRTLRQWRTLREVGAGDFTGRSIRRRIASLSFHDKSERLVELELADLVVTPIGRHIVGYPDRPDWEIVHEKLYGGSETAIEVVPINE